MNGRKWRHSGASGRTMRAGARRLRRALSCAETKVQASLDYAQALLHAETSAA
jgi:hypothetical protein